MQQLKKGTAHPLAGVDGTKNHLQKNAIETLLGCQAQPQETENTLDAALRYASAGIPIIPCLPNKRPYTKHGYKDATTDHKQIKRWWKKWPNAFIGMPTGERSGILVLDVDIPDGALSLAMLETEVGPLPVTVEVRTQSGGRHLYFKNAPGIKNSAGKLGKNLDIRAEGGHVIIPPSPGYTFVKGGII